MAISTGSSTPAGGGSKFKGKLLSGLEREFQCERLRQKIQEYKIQHFMEIKDSVKFLNSDYEELKGVLESEDLNVSCEEDVFAAIKQWYKHDILGRERHLPDLIGCLRLSQFDANFILTNIHPLPGCELLALKAIVSQWDSQLLARKIISLKFKEPRQSSHKYLREKSYFAVEKSGIDPAKCLLRYNKTLDKWLKYADIDTPRIVWCGVVLKDDNLIFTAGFRLQQVNEVGSWNFRSKTWNQLPVMTYFREHHMVALLDGKMYVMGGDNGKCAIASVEVFSSTGGWRTVRSMNTPRFSAAAVTFNGNIFVMGGEKIEPLNSVERYDPTTDIWTFCANMNNTISYHGAAVHNGFIYVVGDAAAERYDPQRNVWTNICVCPSGIARPACISLNNQLWAIGGWWCGAKDCTYVYNEESDRWVEKARLPKSGIYYCFTMSEAFF